MKIIAISGSLRAASHNSSVLHAARRLAPAGVDIELFEGIGNLPFSIPTSKASAFPQKSPGFGR